ncbi:restriction endonuclease subunit S [Streptococcus suis]|nr:restriction endonuclease subunit S [Streptococcus suis]
MPNKNKNIPKRRFKEFENADAWELRKLRNIFHNIENAFVGIATPHYVSDGRFYLESNNIKDGQVNYETKVFISEEFYQRQKNKWLRAGDIVMVQSGHVGHSAVIPEELDCSAAHALIMFRKQKVKISSNFLNYQFQTKQSKKKLDLITTGNTIKHILSSEMKEFNAYFPTLPEQKAIGTFFSTLDQQITLHQRKLDKLKSVKQAYLSEMFPAEGERVPKRRFPGFTDDWELRKLGELTSYRNGKGYEDNQSDFGKYELINLNSISIEGGLKPSGKFINYASETLNKNDLVMVLSDVGHGDLLGRVAIIPEDDRFVLNQRVALLRNNDYADYKYLFAYINANQHYFKLQGAGSSQLNLSKKAVENFVVHIPSQKEQSTIGTFFSTLDRHITLHQRKLEKLKNLKKALLNELFV